jgi:hypothetical protein
MQSNVIGSGVQNIPRRFHAPTLHRVKNQFFPPSHVLSLYRIPWTSARTKVTGNRFATREVITRPRGVETGEVVDDARS